MKIEGWVEMWLSAGLLFLCAKWLTVRPVVTSAARPAFGRLAGYVFLWPGLDAAAFCGPADAPEPREKEWIWAVAKTALGAGLLWLAARWVCPVDVRPYLVKHYLRLGYHATNVAFVYLPVVYALAALKGTMP